VLPLDNGIFVIIDVAYGVDGFDRTWSHGAVSAAVVFRCVVDKFVFAEETVGGETGSSIRRQARGRSSCSRSGSPF
jgi:hypothetical protein